MEETGTGGPLSLNSWTLTTWGTVFSVDSVKEVLTTARIQKIYKHMRAVHKVTVDVYKEYTKKKKKLNWTEWLCGDLSFGGATLEELRKLLSDVMR